MTALHLVLDWPVDHVAAAVVTPRSVDTIGDTDREFRLASLSKVLTGWTTMIAHEEGTVDLDETIERDDVPAGATLRHLLSHAAGFPFDGDDPVTGVEQRRIYSNTGIERVAAIVAERAEMPFGQYLREAVFQPLGMTSSELRGSPAHAVWSTVGDMSAFLGEMLTPKLVARESWHDLTRIQYPDLAGIVPGVGSFDPCPWGLGMEVKGAKAPHWTGRANSAATFGHFGGAGTMMWADPNAGIGVVALTDRPFDEWTAEAMRSWPEFSDAVLAEHRSAA
jgi:CubicO group peptidase (beta-lactamase class C family)